MNYIKLGAVLRCVTTVGTFLFLSFHKFVKKYKYILLPIVLTLLDEVDSIPLVFNLKSFYTFEYRYIDKIIDVLSYVFAFAMFKLDNLVLFFILYRMIGVLLFTFTKKSIWVIVFFDFVKEMMLYLYVFDTYAYLPFFIFLKVCFEYYWHHNFVIHDNGDKMNRLDPEKKELYNADL